MVESEDIVVAGTAGRLEAILKRHPTPRGAAVVCHPHPRYGGTMHDKVVYRASRALFDAGLTVLRFNFRGVGASEGEFDDGRGERDDLRAALDHLADHQGPLVAAGFSFGAWIALEVGEIHARVAALVGIGLPVDVFDCEFVIRGRKPLLLVHGERDEWGSVDTVRRLVDIRGHDARLDVIAGARHSLAGVLEPMQHAVAEFVAATSRPRSPES